MKKNILLFFLLLASSIAFAEGNDGCKYIPGHWRGMFAFNDVEDCDRYNGCRHQIEATVKDINIMYNVQLSSNTDVKGIFSVFCDNGKLSTPGTPIPPSRVNFQCYGQNDCHASYEGNRLHMDLYKVAG